MAFVGMSPVAVPLYRRIQIGEFALFTISTDCSHSFESKAFVKCSGTRSGLQDYKIVVSCLDNLFQSHLEQQLSTTQTSHKSNLRYRFKDNPRVLRRSRTRKILQFLCQCTILILRVLTLVQTRELMQGIPSKVMRPSSKVRPQQVSLQPSLSRMSYLHAS